MTAVPYVFLTFAKALLSIYAWLQILFFWTKTYKTLESRLFPEFSFFSFATQKDINQISYN